MAEGIVPQDARYFAPSKLIIGIGIGSLVVD
jgi:hypothetical protein